jgi:hypothetical protein
MNSKKESAMSKVSDLLLDIQYLTSKGKTPVQIAQELEIPINWVYESTQILDEDDELDCSPFATVNS